jgi:hypothetical protein
LQNYNQNNKTMLVYEILNTTLRNELVEISDKYGIPIEDLEGLAISLFVKDNSKQIWKGGKTRFVKAFVKEVIVLIEENEIDWDDLGFLLYLSAKFTNYEDNVLRKENNEYITQTELIEEIHHKKKKKSSPSAIGRKIRDLTNKKLLFSKPHPEDKKAKVFYLTPHLFYKGKLIDAKMKESLINLTIGIRNQIIERKSQEIANKEYKILEFDNADKNDLVNALLEELSKVS